jgi:hypothetical protein
MDANERICCAKEVTSRTRFQNYPHAPTPRNKRRRKPARRPSAGHQLPSPRLAQTSLASRATPSSRLRAAVLGLCAFAAPLRALAAPAPATSLLDEDARLRQALTVRVSRMPLADLLHRMNAALAVRLGVEGEDVADQRIDLFTTSVSAIGILQAITGLLNAEGPRGYRWERRGEKPDYRYVLVRDLASRQWEALRAAEADQQLAHLLRARITTYGSEPFRPNPDRPRELPGMRKLLASLSDAQLTQLLSERLLVLTTATALPRQQPLLKDVVAQMADLQRRQRPELAEQQFALFGPPDKDPSARAEIYLWGDLPRCLIRMGVIASRIGGSTELCEVTALPTADDRPPTAGPETGGPVVWPGGWLSRVPSGGRPSAVRGRRSRVGDLPAAAEEPVFTLPPRSSWLMADVLADLAARARVNLIADDYTQAWPKLARLQEAQPLFAWLAAIRDDYGFEITRDGAFLRLRNRHWWLDRRREVPTPLLTQVAQWVHGSASDRLQAAVAVARWAPLSPNYKPLMDRLQPLAMSPEVSGISTQVGDDSFVTAVARVQTELLMYGALPVSQQRRVTGGGLTMTWTEMPPRFRELFTRRVRLFLEPGLSEESLRRSSVFLQFGGDRLFVRWLLAGLPMPPEMEETLAVEAEADRQRSVGQPLPEPRIEDASGKTSPLRPGGPLLLYVAPAWPRPTVTTSETFADLKAVERLRENTGPRARVLIVGTGGGAAELRAWWKERGVGLPPLALARESAERLGAHGLPLALIVDRQGRIAWRKEGYDPGDAAEWQRQLERLP